jgi:uncharacterized protein YhbP (UPF0306 family)
VYFAADEKCCLYFFSDADSQHALDLQGDARAAAAIHPLVSGWQEIRGLQLRGRVHAVPAGAEWERAWMLYRDKFPFVENLKQVVARSTLYVFEPDWVRLVDNRQEFGWKEERQL